MLIKIHVSVNVNMNTSSCIRCCKGPIIYGILDRVVECGRWDL